MTLWIDNPSSTSIPVLVQGGEVWTALREALEWCETFHLAGTTVGGAGTAFWDLVLDHSDRLGKVYVAVPEESDADLLAPLHEGDHLRTTGENGLRPGNLVWFISGLSIRVLVVSAPLGDLEPERACPPCFSFSAAALEQAPGLLEFIRALRSVAQRAAPADLERWLTPPAGERAASAGPPPVYQRVVRSVRDVVPAEQLRGRDSFLAFEADAQELALWTALFGEGDLELDQAVRLAAERLRAQGDLTYGALRTAGTIYQTVEERLRSARRRGELFDTPKQGHIRAVEANLEALTAADWRDCLLGGLRETEHVDRNQALRLAFEYGRDVYGLQMQRLRTGGKAERALKSALNSAIRQGLLKRDGAGYVLRVAEYGLPVLRGVVQEAAPASEAEPPATETPPPESGGIATPPEPSTAPETDAALPAAEGQELPEPAPLPTEAPPPTEDVVGPDVSSPLDRELFQLEFPTRTLNWAEGQQILTVRDLVLFDPAKFANEQNVGRLTMTQTRAALEEALGKPWELARATLLSNHNLSVAPQQVDEETITAGGARGWTAFASLHAHELAHVPLAQVELPTRMRHYASQHGLVQAGELLALSHDELVQTPNLGRKTINDTLDALQDALTNRTTEAPRFATFLDAWRAQLVNLKPMHRMIITRRAGAHGAKETLEELGVMLGITRERVRQIEARVIERLREKARWQEVVRAELDDAFGAARALPLEFLREERFWADLGEDWGLLDFFFRRILDGAFHLIEGPSGRRYVARFAAEDLASCLAAARARLETLGFPARYETIAALLAEEAARLDPLVLPELEDVLREELYFDERDPEQVNGFGRRRGDEVIAYLAGQAEPVPVGVIEEKFGRGHLPEEVLYFKRGTVGLEKHFPDFEAWRDRLVPEAIAVMQSEPGGRQWLIPDVHERLVAGGKVPDWMGHWHLASLLRTSGQVSYLGRLRVALLDSGHERRLQFEDVFVDILQHAGGPLPSTELVARVREHTDIRDETAAMLVNQAPFVRLDGERIGLVERDIPGGADAVAAAVEALANRLRELDHGVTPYQATLLVQGLSEAHAGWTRELVLSVLRSEPSLRIDRSRNIGLDAWDDARFPTRAEFVRREVQRAGGNLETATLNQRLAEVYGQAPDRTALYQLALEVGFVLGQDSVWSPTMAAPVAGWGSPEATEVAPPSSRRSTPPGRNVPGIPAELREFFVELSSAALRSPDELAEDLERHLGEFEQEYLTNEFVDLPGARLLHRQGHVLLSHWDRLSPEERTLAQAAITYFVLTQDVENDFDLDGLSTDKQIMGAVLAHLGLEG